MITPKYASPSLLCLTHSKISAPSTLFKYIRSYKMSTNQGPTNFNQPQSLVKYSNPVLVSSSGKKQVKVLSLLVRTSRSILKT